MWMFNRVLESNKAPDLPIKAGNYLSGKKRGICKLNVTERFVLLCGPKG